jgi:hypothetical protein
MKRNQAGVPIMSAYRASRLPVSCHPCREKKRRCDRNKPCSNCTQRRLNCVYENGNRFSNAVEGDAAISGALAVPDAPTMTLSPIEQMNMLVSDPSVHGLYN